MITVLQLNDILYYKTEEETIAFIEFRCWNHYVIKFNV
jgi:hypothetical protein